MYYYVNAHVCNYALTIFTHFCPSACLHFSLCLMPQFIYQAGSTLTLNDCPVFISVRQTCCKFISSFLGFCSAGAWHALCFWIGVSVFVPGRELEIRLRPFCTCIPFTSHLIPLTITHTLSVPLGHTELKLLQGRFL